MAKKSSDGSPGIIAEPSEKHTSDGSSAIVAGPPEKHTAAPEDNRSGFYIYLGPNIKGLIQTGSIYRGSREDALQTAASAIERFPLVKTLIVSGDALPTARLKVKTPGNALYANYHKLAGK